MMERNSAAAAQDNGDVSYVTGMGQAATPQPPPKVTGGPSAHDALCDWMRARSPGLDAASSVQRNVQRLLLDVYALNGEAASVERIIADTQARKAFGLQKYGTHLTVDNGRKHLVDVMQELLDALVYLQVYRMQKATEQP
jgi:hypothetical protein